MIFFAIRKLQSEHLMIGSAVVLGLIAFAPYGGNPVMIVVDRAISAYSFMVAGYYSKALVQLAVKKKLMIGFALVSVWIMMLCCFPYEFEYFEGIFCHPMESIITISTASLGSILLLSCINKRIAVLEYIGKNSLLFMLCHPTFIKIYIVLGVSKIASMSPSIQIVGSLTVYLLVIVGAALFGEIVKRWFPFMIGKKYGNSNGKKK